MQFLSVHDEAFRPYGAVLAGYDTRELCGAMRAFALPESGTAYKTGIESLESCAVFPALRERAYAGMPIQLGMCWGRNTKLNCFEYHRGSEINIGAGDYVLLLARLDEMENGMLDTAKVKAFRAGAGEVIQLYETTLHFAPCHLDEREGFRVAVALPLGTNTEKPEITPGNDEDQRLWMRNKWLLAHPESKQAKLGAYIGLRGENIDIAEMIA